MRLSGAISDEPTTMASGTAATLPHRHKYLQGHAASAGFDPDEARDQPKPRS